MEIVLGFDSKNMQKLKDVLLKDDVVSRASIIFKEGSIIGKKGYFCYIRGTEEQCKRVLELTKDLVTEISGKDKEELINKIKEEENKASEGMGDIFG